MSGALFEVTEQSPTVYYDGHTYTFCCGACVAYFEQHRDMVIARRLGR